VVADQERLAGVLGQVYGRLALPCDPASVGSVSAEVPGLGAPEVESAVLAAYGADGVAPMALDAKTLGLARTFVTQRRP
jgi:octanoyl-[GcvH]:protein N-octanoyltransferase